jgi:hypothetical protein
LIADRVPSSLDLGYRSTKAQVGGRPSSYP